MQRGKARWRPYLNNVIDVLVDAGYSPAEALVKCAKRAERESENEEYAPNVRAQFLTLAQKANSDLLEYIAPKLSRTEHVGKDGGAIKIEAIERTIVDASEN